MKEDKRIINTKQKIKLAYIKKLTNLKNDDIKINDICIEAKINRSTFYDHYIDKLTLYKEIENEALYIVNTFYDDIDTNDLESILYKLLTYIKLNNNIFMFIIKDDQDSLAGKSMYNGFINIISSFVKNESIIYNHFIYNGFINTIYEWLTTFNNYTIEEIVNVIVSIIFTNK